ncbi:MAG: squalene/phytoene synthase family protein [Acidiphilium sp.]|nr:squalene/phytoene synthase family protein [Acidiphilium sp.]MDD4935593.1 squalene/phytoene synthase family protein [Acidiphilium sp.]
MTERELAALVRRADPDRFLGAIFAPPAQRHALLTLYAFNHELARAGEVASTPPLVLIRLHWWREVVQGAAREHPVANLLRDALHLGVFDPEDLIALIDVREAEAEPIADLPAFLAYTRGTAGRLMRVAGRALGLSHPDELTTLEDIGAGYAIASILRAAPALQAVGRNLLPADGTEPTVLIGHAHNLLTRNPPRAALAVTLPAVLARRDLARLRRGDVLRPRGLGDRMAVIATALKDHFQSTL